MKKIKKDIWPSNSSETITPFSFEREMLAHREHLIYLRDKPINAADILVFIVMWYLLCHKADTPDAYQCPR